MGGGNYKRHGAEGVWLTRKPQVPGTRAGGGWSGTRDRRHKKENGVSLLNRGKSDRDERNSQRHISKVSVATDDVFYRK